MSSEDNRHFERLGREVLGELRARRRWKIFWRFLFLALFLFYFFVLFGRGLRDFQGDLAQEFVALVRIEGVISSDDYANAEDINSALKRAFEAEGAKAVFLQINSPGGSPVQSGQIYRNVMRLKEKHGLPVYAFIDDLGASGAYYVAAAADEIFADPSSIVGSIGVISQGFADDGALKKLGIEGRVYKAGEYKDFLSPLRPVTEEELVHMQGLLSELHRQFIDAVKDGRGARLSDDVLLFSGLFWTGEQALDLGLVDGNEDLAVVLEENFEGLELRDFSVQPSALDRVLRNVGMQSRATLRNFSGSDAKVQFILSP